ncbi:MAG: hypothetical protein ACXQS2_05255 [Methermicoccaceae archaeon]
MKDDNSTVMKDNNASTLVYSTFNMTTFDESGKIELSVGGLARMISGLQYLVGYPHGCVEQTASPALSAM